MAGLTFVPTAAHAAVARRTFDILRDGDPVGVQTLAISQEGDRIDVAIDISIQVKILGITAYRYEMTNRESWEAGEVISIESETNDDGTAERVSARRTAEGLEISGSKYSGVQTGSVATTTYWAQAFLSRPVWISTQDGTPYAVQAENAGREVLETPSGPVPCTHWRITGDLPLDLYYDDQGEWIANAFGARGDRAMLLARDRTTRLSTLWTGG